VFPQIRALKPRVGVTGFQDRAGHLVQAVLAATVDSGGQLVHPPVTATKTVGSLVHAGRDLIDSGSNQRHGSDRHMRP